MSTRAHKPCRGGGGRRRQRGAALLLLLMVLGMGVAGLAIQAYSGASSRDTQAWQTLGRAREALVGYGMMHGRLPRPASSPDSGLEDAQPCASDRQCTGYLPWATLGIEPTYARGKPLRYSVTPAFAAPDTRLRTAIPTKTISQRLGQRLVYEHGQQVCTLAADCMPAVLIASGKFQGLSGGGDQGANDGADMHFIRRPHSDDERLPGGVFDDLVAWVSYDTLIRRASVTGALQ